MRTASPPSLDPVPPGPSARPAATSRRPGPLGRALAVLLALGAVLGAVRPAPAEPVEHALLRLGIARLVEEARLPPGRYGIAVLERGPRPAVVFADGQTLSLIPASTAKVLTAVAALDWLGPGHVFTTRLTARGAVDETGTLDGDLVVHGAGDPNLSGRQHDGEPRRLLDAFARVVASKGIRRVRGALVVDDGPFDREYVHPSWSRADRERWYGAGVGGCAFNDGCVDVRVEGASAAGRPARVVAPSTVGPWGLESSVGTVADGRPAVGGMWVDGATRLRVRGTIAAGRTYAFSHPVPDPCAFLGGALHAALEAQGVTIEGGMRLARDAADRRPGTPLLQHGSDLATSLKVMNERSQNFYAGMLFKAAGVAATGEGSWASGEAAVAGMLRRRGLEDGGKTRIVDGSGLSRDNRATAATLARLLLDVERDPLRGPLLRDSLAEPGGDGTLRRRLRDGDLEGRVHAKTGTLSGVRALAGYVDGLDGHPGYVFCALLNTSRGGRAFLDDLVREIARR